MKRIILITAFAILGIAIFFVCCANALAYQVEKISTPTAGGNSTVGVEYWGAKDPCVYNDTIIWIDGDIFLHNLLSGAQTNITNDGTGHSSPSIYGDKLVYSENRGGVGAHIYIYNIATGVETQVPSDAGATPGMPFIYKDKIVYVELTASSECIAMYNITTAEKRIVYAETNMVYHNITPAMYENTVVWDRFLSSGHTIRAFDLSTNTLLPEVIGDGRSRYPRIYKDKIVWQEMVGDGNWDIYMYDLITKTTKAICAAPLHQLYPDIYENKIVWEDFRDNGDMDIYMYDIATSTETHFELPYHQVLPRIYDNKIVFEELRDAGSNQFISDINVLKLECYAVRVPEGSMNIDGQMNEPQWNLATWIKVVFSPTDNPVDNTTAKAKFLWDARKFYVLVDVSDQHVETAGRVQSPDSHDASLG